MEEDNIIQFVGFNTDFGHEEFYNQWEYYSGTLDTVPDTTILQQGAGTKNRFQYLSQHEFLEQGLRFAFGKSAFRRHSPEMKITVTQLGGYSPIKIEAKYYDDNNDVKVMAFINHDQANIEKYTQLAPYRYLNIYQAYFENCMYSYILEFFTSEDEASGLLRELKTCPGTEAEIYKACAVQKI
jgi:hypothetical protein